MYAWGFTSIVDVGSEEGDFTTLYASWDADVAFIDPSAGWVNQTLTTFTVNGLTPGVSFVGLADKTTSLDAPVVSEKRFVTVDENCRRIRLDDFVRLMNRPPEAVTMDVEGSELRVLEGAGELLADDTVWWISVHDCDPHAGMPSKVHELMRGYGYRDQWLGSQHEHWYRFWRTE